MNPDNFKKPTNKKPSTLDPMFLPDNKATGKVKPPSRQQPAKEDTKRAPKPSKASVAKRSSRPKKTNEGQFNPSKYIKSYKHTPEKPKSKKKKRSKLRKIILLLVLLFVLFAGYATSRIFNSASNIFSGGYLDIFKNEQLDKDKYGRVNILVFGTSEDDEGHSGAELTDSIMLLSIDEDTKKGNIVSIPRDLWVKYSEPCSVGYEGKINSVYFCNLENGKNEQEASEALTRSVGSVLGADIKYFAKVNYTVVRDLVNELDGIEVVIESSDPRGILDRGMDKKCPDGPYTCYMVNFPNGPAQLNGDQALALARARNAKGGYGLSRSNFDRELNQQKIVRAIQEKALSTGMLTNPDRVFGVADSLGNNVVTNIRMSQVRSLIDTARHANSDQMKTIDLADKKKPLVNTGSHNGQSIVKPAAGLYDFTEIHKAIEEAFTPRKDSVGEGY